ncbi:hypothetical protein BGY98DRAFT_263862 [Russula aff. rugulosa BPL654]|nr:hypothetical protein BGY98DRAFT_263862 [Russula aff. rugulosa BPL654]
MAASMAPATCIVRSSVDVHTHISLGSTARRKPKWPCYPFASTIWAGSCDVGQLTPGGLVDASQHGKVGASVSPRVCRALDGSNRIYGNSACTIGIS